MSRHKLHEAIRFVRPVAGAVDRVIRPRLSWLTEGPFTYAIAAICILIALSISPLELMPFAAAAPALAVTCSALA